MRRRPHLWRTDKHDTLDWLTIVTVTFLLLVPLQATPAGRPQGTHPSATGFIRSHSSLPGIPAAIAVTPYVSAGYEHTCALKSDGTLICWGYNNSGQTSAPSGAYTAVSAGGYHSCALKMDGTAVCWGDSTTVPSGTFSQISAGYEHTCAIRTDGTLACWGYNGYGEASPPSGTFSQVSAGSFHTCGIRTDGTLACWGENNDGESSPPSGTFSQISAGGHHSCGLTIGGELVCWGRSENGQIPPPGVRATQISAGFGYTCAIQPDSTVACWDASQLPPPSGDFSQISLGGFHACGIKTDSTVVCWGANTFGQSSPPGSLFSPAEQTATVLALQQTATAQAQLTPSPTGTLPTATPSPTPSATPIYPPVTASLYVAPTGSNNNSCQTPLLPCQTITGAVSRSAPGNTIAVAAGTYSERVILTQDTTLVGAGAGQTVIQPPGPGTTVQIASGAVSISGMTIQNGHNFPPAPAGGGISNSGTLTLTNSIIRNNYDDDAGGGIGNGGTLTVVSSTISNNSTRYDGGGIYSVGTLTVISSTVSGNQAVSDMGGGIANDGVMTVTQTTINGNDAGHLGGGLSGSCTCSVTLLTQSTVDGNTANDGSDGGISNDGIMTATDSTISGNNGGGIGQYFQTLWLLNSTVANNVGADGGVAVAGGSAGLSDSTVSGNSGVFYGGGVSAFGGSLQLANTIVAGNTTSFSGPPSYKGPPDCYGALTSLGDNLLGNPTGCSGVTTGVNGDQVGTAAQPLDAHLGPLQDNGGPTLTMALLPGSPAIDAVPATHCTVAADQRGQPRPDEVADIGACDIGAYESGPPTLRAARAAAVPLEAVGMSGQGFAPAESLAIFWDVTGTTPLTTVTTTLSGTFGVTITLPQAISGTHTLIAVGQTSGLSATTTLRVVPYLHLTPYSGPSGSMVTVAGVGFGSGQSVALHWATPTGPVLGTTTTSAQGSFGGPTAIRVSVPISRLGTHLLYATGASGAVAAVTLFLVA